MEGGGRRKEQKGKGGGAEEVWTSGIVGRQVLVLLSRPPGECRKSLLGTPNQYR